MKAEHAADSTFDRISTREELCEVIDLLCDSGDAIAGSRPNQRRRSIRLDAPSAERFSSDLVSGDLEYEIDDDDPSAAESAEDTDELSATLSDLFSGETEWLN